MATGLTAAVAALSATVAIWIVWRARAAAARRLEIQRALEVMTEDGSGLLSAVVTSLDTHRRSSGAADPDLDTARASARALARLVAGAQAYVRDPDRHVARAEGLVRVGIALARSRGHRVLLRGAATELETQADAQTTCLTVRALVEALAPRARSAGAPEFVEITLEKEGLRLVGKASGLEGELEELLRVCGWSLRNDGDGAWYLAAGVAPPGPRADERAQGAESLAAR